MPTRNADKERFREAYIQGSKMLEEMREHLDAMPSDDPVWPPYGWEQMHSRRVASSWWARLLWYATLATLSAIAAGVWLHLWLRLFLWSWRIA